MSDLSTRVRAMTFEQYVSEWDAKSRPLRAEPYERCQNCGGSEPVSRDGICRECLRYHYGWDEAEETLVTAMVGGAIKGALKTGASPELIAVAVQRALKEQHDAAGLPCAARRCRASVPHRYPWQL